MTAFLLLKEAGGVAWSHGGARPLRTRHRVTAYINRFWGVVATVMIMGCGGPSPDSPVVGQVSESAEALPLASTSDRARATPGVNASVRHDPVQSFRGSTPAQQNSSHVALLPKTTDGSCAAPDSHVDLAASPAAASLSNQRSGAACVRREVQHGREVQGQVLPDVTEPLQAQALWIKQHSLEMAPMTYTQADLENEPDQTHELWLEQGIQEVMEFETL